MANPLLCFPNWTLPSAVYAPTFAAPGWIDTGLLQGTVLSEMARYPGVTPADTRLVVDLKTLRPCRVLALPFHNASLGDRARLRLYTDAALTDLALDSGWKEFFGVIYPYGSLPVSHISCVDGRMDAEQAAGLRPLWWHIAPEEVLGRYLLVELDFTGNPDGCCDLGQIVASSGISPKYNFSYGVKPPYYRDPSTKRRSKGGPVFADRQRPFRTTSMQLDWLGQAELYGPLYDMVRRYGVTEPFLFIYDPAAPEEYFQKQSFMAVAERIGDPAHPRYGAYDMTIDINEVF